MSVENLQKGKYRVRWRDETGRPRCKIIQGERRRAIAYEKDVRLEVARKKENIPSSSTECSEKNEILYRDYLTDFCEIHATEYSEENAKQHLRAGVRLIKLAGNLPLGEYTTQHILGVRAGILTEGHSPRLANKTVNQLRAQFKRAVLLKYIDQNPVSSPLLKALKEDGNPRRALSLEEIKRIVALADTPFNDILTIAYTTGMRVGELFRIQIENVWGEMLIIPVTKTHKPRQVPLTPEAMKAVASLKGSRRKGRLIQTHENNTSFRSHLAVVLKIAYYRATHKGNDPKKRTRRWVQKNIPDITTQDLRHSYVSILRENGVDSELRARLAGHSKKVDESIYTHTGDKTLKEAVEKAFGGKNGEDDEGVIQALSVCRAILRGETAPEVSDDVKAWLKRVLEGLGGLFDE